ncbi:MAG: 50S ribosomal protein L11 methyltransferase, partial [Eubacteriales bacterium]
MIWTQIKVKCNVTDLETVSAVMSMLDNFIMTEDYRDIDTELKSVYGDLIDESILKADKSKGSCSIFVPEEKNVSEYISYINERLPLLGIPYETEIINTADEEWSTAWKKYYKPTPIGKRIVIVPSWEHYDKKDGEIIIDMDPGMAFGTGTHETTRLCASLLEKYIKQGDKMLDIGSGSGILAICGAKLGASS